VDEKSIPLIQDITRDYPPGCDDVCPVTAVAAASRRPSVRTEYRRFSRDGAHPVEPLQTNICCGDQEATRSAAPAIPAARAGDGEIQKHKITTEILLDPFFSP